MASRESPGQLGEDAVFSQGWYLERGLGVRFHKHARLVGVLVCRHGVTGAQKRGTLRNGLGNELLARRHRGKVDGWGSTRKDSMGGARESWDGVHGDVMARTRLARGVLRH